MTEINTTETTPPVIDKTIMHMPPGTVIEKHHSHLGPILGILVIVLVLILTGLYIWGGFLSNEVNTVPTETPIINNEPETPRAEADQTILETLSPSDDMSAIEADINSTNLDSLDSELTTIDVELEAGLQTQ